MHGCMRCACGVSRDAFSSMGDSRFARAIVYRLRRLFPESMRPIGFVALLVLAVVAVGWGGAAWLLGEDLSPSADGGSAGDANPGPAGQLQWPPVAGIDPAGKSSPKVFDVPADAAPVRPSSPQPPAQGLVLFPPLKIPPGGAVAIDPFAEGGPSPVVVAPVPPAAQVPDVDGEKQDRPQAESQ